MRIAFVIHSLRRGGSERQLIALAIGLADRGHDVAVFVLRGGGALEQEFRDGSVVCTDLSRDRPWYRPRALFDAVRALRGWRPDIVHPYLVETNLLVALLRPALGPVRLVWGVRAAGEGGYHPLSGLAFAATSIAARTTDLVIANSEAGRRYHVRHGYPPHKVMVIENGIDTTRFRYDPSGRERVRREWGVPPDAPLIGLVGRLDPLKDHETFLRAAGELAREDNTVRFVCIGSAPGPRLEQLDRLGRSLGLSDRLTWSNQREDMAAVYSALDGGCLSSVSEGFPNVVAEAMACGTPCVVTDVGDAAEIVDELGVVAPPRDPSALAHGMQEIVRRGAGERRELRDAVRDRIVTRYPLARLVTRTEELLCALWQRA